MRCDAVPGPGRAAGQDGVANFHGKFKFNAQPYEVSDRGLSGALMKPAGLYQAASGLVHIAELLHSRRCQGDLVAGNRSVIFQKGCRQPVLYRITITERLRRQIAGQAFKPPLCPMFRLDMAGNFFNPICGHSAFPLALIPGYVRCSWHDRDLHRPVPSPDGCRCWTCSGGRGQC